MFFPPRFSELDYLKHKYNSEHLLRCFSFIFFFVCASSQFTNEDAESQKFLTNGFLGDKKLADYSDEHVSQSLLWGSKQDRGCLVYRGLCGKTMWLKFSKPPSAHPLFIQALTGIRTCFSCSPYGYINHLWNSFVFWRNHSNPNVICNQTCFPFFMLPDPYFLFFPKTPAATKHSFENYMLLL